MAITVWPTRSSSELAKGQRLPFKAFGRRSTLSTARSACGSVATTSASVQKAVVEEHNYPLRILHHVVVGDDVAVGVVNPAGAGAFLQVCPPSGEPKKGFLLTGKPAPQYLPRRAAPDHTNSPALPDRQRASCFQFAPDQRAAGQSARQSERSLAPWPGPSRWAAAAAPRWRPPQSLQRPSIATSQREKRCVRRAGCGVN